MKPEHCLVFEDVPMGIRAGKNAGMRVCAVEDSFSAHQEKEKRRLADYYISSYEQVLDNTYEIRSGYEGNVFANLPGGYGERGIRQFDFVYVIGDAYVDHPSFGPAIISRLLESRGYTVAVISQPDWRRKESVQVFGEPRLAFLVSSGNMDSMVNHYTVSKKAP